MDKFIAREKMSPKARKALDSQRRASWAISPVTRKAPNKKANLNKHAARIKDDPGLFCISAFKLHRHAASLSKAITGNP